MTTYIGVDGGGTKTHVLVMNGNRGATLTTAASNPQTVGMETAEQVISQAMVDCLRALNLAATDVEALSICMSGVDREDEANYMRAAFQRQYPGAVLEVKNDALAAITAGTKGEPGVVLIAGTGSIAVGESESGNIVRAGGYGYLLGDEGSGFNIGQMGLIAAIQSFEGRAPRTRLWERARDVYGVSNAMELIPIVYRADRPVNTIAKFAQEVVTLADTDAVANEIVAKAISDYLQLIQSVLRRLDGNTKNVVLAGGLFTHTTTLVNRLRTAEPSMNFVPLSNSAASGAALRAIKESYRGRGKSAQDALEVWQNNLAVMEATLTVPTRGGTVLTYG